MRDVINENEQCSNVLYKSLNARISQSNSVHLHVARALLITDTLALMWIKSVKWWTLLITNTLALIWIRFVIWWTLLITDTLALI